MTELHALLWRHLRDSPWYAGGPGELISVRPLPWLSGRPLWVRAELAEVEADDGSRQLYQLLLAYRPAGEASPGAIDETVHPELGRVAAYDAARDHDALAIIVDRLLTGGEVGDVAGHRMRFASGSLRPGLSLRPVGHGRSGSSVRVGDSYLLKFFRRIHRYASVEIEVLRALTAGPAAPSVEVRGAIDATWPIPQETPEFWTELAMVVDLECEAGGETVTGRQLAERAAAEGTPFAEQAVEFGRTLRALHDRLVDAFGGDASGRDELTGRGRQRVHGSLDLDAFIRSATGWKIIDIEADPTRSPEQRRALDLPSVDLESLGRSLREAGAAAGETWVTEATDALLRGYLGDDQQPAETPGPPGDETRFGGLAGWDFEGFHRGGDTELWKRLGSHVVTVAGADGPVTGTRFAVWAPQARAVSVAGDFNGWTGTVMELVPGTGVWATFVPGVPAGALYKYNVLTADGNWLEKADPMARYAEVPPATASIVWESGYTWGDADWLERRATLDARNSPISIYEIHLGSWRGARSYRDLADELVEYVTWQGFTHVEFLPLAQHPFAPSWGYQVTGYFAAQSTLGDPDGLRYLIDRLHQAGIGVLLDWVPGHFPKDAWGLGRFDGSALYEHADPRQGEHQDWGTYIFNFGRNEVKSFLVSNALYWIQEFHIDGLRVDAVASMLYLDYSRNEGEWVPNAYGGRENLEAIDFLRYVNTHLHERVPGVLTIAEESTSFPAVTWPAAEGGLGFSFKWNMGWMNDTLSYLGHDPVHRQYHHNSLTFSMMYAWSEAFILPISHDEVVHGKGSMVAKIPGDDWQKFATLRAFYAYMWSHPGKQLLFMGQEFGMRPEFDEAKAPEWWVSELPGHRGLQLLLRDLNLAYAENPALWTQDCSPAGFTWLDADDAAGNVISYLRHGSGGEMIAAVINFSPIPRDEHRIGLPAEGVWREILNTDSEFYDGTGKYGNAGQVVAGPVPHRGFEASAGISVPPLGAIWLRYEPDER